MLEYEYNTLIQKGNIGFYESCEITEIFIYSSSDKKQIFNFYTLAAFEEKPFENKNEHYLCQPITITNQYKLGIKRYWVVPNEILTDISNLAILNTINNSKLKNLTKQYIPDLPGNRLNSILKNNFSNGAYVLELFDEEKSNLDFILKMEELTRFNILCEKIKKILPIDLSTARDRIGNFIFQFPVKILDISSTALPNWNGVKIEFDWHSSMSFVPDCIIEVTSTIEKRNYLGFSLENYNKENSQTIIVGNIDAGVEIKIWRKDPNLLLNIFEGSYLRRFGFNAGIISSQPRFFIIDGKQQKVDVNALQRSSSGRDETLYLRHINSSVYTIEKDKLQKTLSFKQYIKTNNEIALEDIRTLIRNNDHHGVYLWDPYLRANDILKTLFFSKTMGVQIRAIGSITSETEKVYNNKGKNIKDIIKEQFELLENPSHNNHGLKLEYRIQHSTYGWKFHDRFLIFPGYYSSDEIVPPRVYALGTSINSYGTEHNILQEVSYPQPVIDSFNELWEQLNHKTCLVWKYPK